jgi:hypothetical protein
LTAARRQQQDREHDQGNPGKPPTIGHCTLPAPVDTSALHTKPIAKD